MHEFVGLIELCVTDCSKVGAKKVDDENNFTIRVANLLSLPAEMEGRSVFESTY